MDGAGRWREGVLPDAMSQPVQIVPVRTRSEREAFLNVPWHFYRGNPAWVPPMLFDVRRQLDPAQGDFFRHSTGAFFIAYRGAEPVGRIAALHSTRHLAVHDDGAGFFGFFECEDAVTTAQALLGVAENWLRARGLRVARGPANFSIQDEAGVLLDGFEHAPMAGMAYTPPYYRGLLEAAGYGKAKDLFVCRIHRDTWNDAEIVRLARLTERVAAGVTIRSLDMSDMQSESVRMATIFAEAWRDNWGAQPITAEEFLKYAAQYRLFLDPRLILLAERDGEPLGMMVAVPNMNEVIARIDGRLLPLGWWRLWRDRKRITTIRLFLLGVRASARRLGLPLLFIKRYHELLMNSTHLKEMEFSWILEDNHETLALIQRMGGRRVQTLRLYEKALR
jgi:GNAT superfamily N-acetyltransferase